MNKWQTSTENIEKRFIVVQLVSLGTQSGLFIAHRFKIRAIGIHIQIETGTKGMFQIRIDSQSFQMMSIHWITFATESIDHLQQQQNGEADEKALWFDTW